MMDWVKNQVDFEITPSVHAIFNNQGGSVLVLFTVDGKYLPQKFTFFFGDAEQLGKHIEETGEWADFPIGGVPTDRLKAFGARLREYGQHGY